MSTKTDGELILEEWISSLRTTRDKTYRSVRANFDDLNEAWKNAGVDSKVANAMLDLAIKAHYPKIALAKNLYFKNAWTKKAFDSYQDYYKDWCDNIKAQAMASYFDFYPINMSKEDDDGQPKVYGSMSKKEYSLQRKYADSFPSVDYYEIEKRIQERKRLQENNLNILGDNNVSDKENS